MGIKRFTIGAFETNTYLITKNDRAVIVDPGLDFESILDEVSKYKILIANKQTKLCLEGNI